MKDIAITLFAAASTFAALPVLAHGGHGATPASSLGHYLIEPLHALAVFGPLAFVAVAVWLLRRDRNGV